MLANARNHFISPRKQFSKRRNPPLPPHCFKSNQMHFDHAAPSVADSISHSSFRMERLGANPQEINRHQTNAKLTPVAGLIGRCGINPLFRNPPSS